MTKATGNPVLVQPSSAMQVCAALKTIRSKRSPSTATRPLSCYHMVFNEGQKFLEGISDALFVIEHRILCSRSEDSSESNRKMYTVSETDVI